MAEALLQYSNNMVLMVSASLNGIYEALKLYQQEGVTSDGGVTGGVTGGVNNIRTYIQMNPGHRANTIANALEIPLRTVERYLFELKKAGEIEFRGAPRNGGYFLKSEGGGVKDG